MSKQASDTKKLIIATRKSPLALWQAEFIKAQLLKHYPDLVINFLGLTTQGDKLLDSALYDLGGKGLFLKELETALLDGRADIAVHSMKDVPAQCPPGLNISAILKREDPRDVLVSNNFASLMELPQGSIVGTASLRRQAQLANIRPDLNFKLIRGNVGTRLAKLDNGEYDALVLAAAGLKRLNQENRITEYLEPDVCLPSVAQGIIGVETREDDLNIQKLLSPLTDNKTKYCLTAERAMNARLGGGCHVPIAGHATLLSDNSLELNGLVARVDGKKIISSTHQGKILEAYDIGIKVAEELLDKGAAEIINKNS